MKHSYKLYGAYWDHKALPQKIFAVKPVSEASPRAYMISLSDVMKREMPTAVDERGQQNSLLIDFIPANRSPVIWNFYLMRLLQIAGYYDAELVCKDEENIIYINDALKDLEKRKASEELLAQPLMLFG